MKNVMRLMVIGALCAVGFQAIAMAPRYGAVPANGAAFTSDEARMAIAGRVWMPVPAPTTTLEDYKETAKYVVPAIASWTIARQYQLARDCGWKALFTHEDSWPVFFKDIIRDCAIFVKDCGRDYIVEPVCSGAKSVAKSSAKSVADCAKATASDAKSATKAFYANHRDACTVAGTVAIVLSAAYIAHCVGKNVPAGKNAVAGTFGGPNNDSTDPTDPTDPSCAQPVVEPVVETPAFSSDAACQTDAVCSVDSNEEVLENNDQTSNL